MNNLSVFDFKSHQVRVITDSIDTILFVANDVGSALGYKNIKNALAKHCKGVAKRYPLSTDGGIQNVRVIDEPDLYRLIFGSKLKSAEQFQDWVFEDVLPTIRKTGKYEIPYSVNPTDTLSKEQADELRELITSTAEKLPKSERAGFTIKGWSKLKSHFGVTYRKIPQQQYAEALSIVSRHVADSLAQPVPQQSMFHGLQDGRYQVAIEQGKTIITDINAIEGELLPKDDTPKLPELPEGHVNIPFNMQKNADYMVRVREGKASRKQLLYCANPQDEKQDWWLEA